MILPLYGDVVLKLIPQRPPVVMVDVLLDYDDTSAKSGLTVSQSNLFVQEGILQESGLLEHMAQAVAMHTGYSYFIRNEQAPTGYIGSIQSAEIKRLPHVGEVIVSEIQILQEFMGVTLVNVCSIIEREIIASAQMKTVIAASN